MDLPINDLTYHSKKKANDQLLHSFTPINMPLKFKQHQPPRHPITSSFGIKDSFLTNMHISDTPLHHNVSPIAYLQGSQQKTEHKGNYQLEQQRQKVRTLSEHLKSALMANNQVEQRYNMLKLKMQEKQVKFMNETSLIKAQMIILQKDFSQKNQQVRKKNEQVNELKLIIQGMQKSQKSLMDKYQLQVKHSESLKNQLVNQRLFESQLSQIKQLLNKKDNEISMLSQRLQSQKRQIHQYENMLKKQQQHLTNVQHELNQTLKLNQSLNNQNNSLKQTIQTQKNRIQQLNKHIGQICQNSDHLFDEIKQNQIQKDIMHQQMDQKQLENINLNKNLQEIIDTCNVYQLKCEQLKMTQDILDQKNRQILDKHTQLQSQNIDITRINTELLRQIQLLDQEVKQLKQVCLRQQTRQAQLLTIIKDSEDQICRLKKQLKEQAVSNIRKQLQRQLKPTRDIEKRTKTQTDPFTPYHKLNPNLNQSRLPRENHNDTKGRFNYLNEHQYPNELTNPPKQLHPYSQYLSFQPSKPYQSTKPLQQDPRTQGYTFGDLPDRRHSRQFNQRNNYFVPEYKPSVQNDRKARSFYVERKNSLVTQPNDVYKSTLNPRQKAYHSIKAMRNSLDLRQKSLDLHNMLKASRRQALDMPKHKKSQKLYTQGANQHQPTYDSKDMFLSRLGKLKLWPKQSTSQQVTQRQALKQLPSSHDYLKPQVPIQTIIKQKSTIQQQRKNMMGFNLNNQMIQKNILKLQKNGESQRVKQNYMDGVTSIKVINEQKSRINDSVYDACRKVVYK